MQNFRLLMSGFCRKFSTLAQEAYNSNIATYRKAAFSIAWMKFLSNFHPGRTTQERIIVETLLKSSNELFDAHCVHGVLSVLHEGVYLVIHDHVRIKKAETESTGTYKARSELHEESEDTLYRYCGASLHRMIKLWQETLAGWEERTRRIVRWKESGHDQRITCSNSPRTFNERQIKHFRESKNPRRRELKVSQNWTTFLFKVCGQRSSRICNGF